jgi:phenylalanyl-tRNA synthetase alpha chain
MEDIKNKIKILRNNFDEALVQIEDKDSLKKLRNTYLGRKKGRVTLLLKELKNVSPGERPEIGKRINELKDYAQKKLEEYTKELQEPKSSKTKVDLTLPGKRRYRGAPHPILLYKKKIEQIFVLMGFSIEGGPEIETDYYNFGALNFPPHHPARDDWDTLYINDDLLLRTHTSPVQIRVMEKKKPPIRMINPGKVYRRETPDPTHIPMFYQVEGLVVDLGITFAHLKGTLEFFLKALYNEKIQIRFRPSFFPFTEPSAEVDIICTVCRGKDPNCRVCGGSGWIEILGAGMVDPQVLKNVNIDPEKYSGFAFGMGIDRTAMFSFRIPDLRNFYENDLRFIRQFS